MSIQFPNPPEEINVILSNMDVKFGIMHLFDIDDNSKAIHLPEDVHNFDQNSVLWRISTRKTADQNLCSHECDSFRIELEYYLF